MPTPTFGEHWRERLQRASFNGAEFHVDSQARAGGRRIALHEFPKKNVPYAEDMGRRARRFTVVGYVIGSQYTLLRDDLRDQLEQEGPGQLQLPTEMNEDVMQVVVDTYSITERRERGGIAEFEMTFVEFGQDTWSAIAADTQSAARGAAQSAASSFKDSSDITRLGSSRTT